MLNKVKTALRISTNAFDAEIDASISAAIDDMALTGILVQPDTPLCTQAIIAYCKWHFGEGNDKFEHIYNEMKAQLITSSVYGGAFRDGQVCTD